MKKVHFIIGGIVILAVAALVLFLVVFYQGDNGSSSFDINGTWFVYQYGETKIDDELLVFDGNQVIDYRNSHEFAKSQYTYADGTLKMPDISKEFVVTVKTDNYIVLTESNTVEWKLARISKETSDIQDITVDELVGEYDVVMVAGEKKTGETMSFSQDSFSDVRDGSVYLSSKYSLDGTKHMLHAEEINKDFHIFIFEKNLVLIDCGERYVWELIKH